MDYAGSGTYSFPILKALAIMNRILFPQRTIVRECDWHYKVYLPRRYNEILKRVHNEGRSVGIVVIPPESSWGDTKRFMLGRKPHGSETATNTYQTCSHGFHASKTDVGSWPP